MYNVRSLRGIFKLMNSQTQIIEMLDANKDLCYSTIEIERYLGLSNSSINRLLRCLKKWNELNYKLIALDGVQYYIYWSINKTRPKFKKGFCNVCQNKTKMYQSYRGLVCLHCRSLQVDDGDIK